MTTLRIAVDAMGSDLGPGAVLDGALMYLSQRDGNGVSLSLVGNRSLLLASYRDLGSNGALPITFVDAPEVVEMGESVTRGLKKRNSSLAVALRMHKEGEVDAVVSAGHTGAFMAQGVLTLGSLEGVSRPAIASTFPTIGERDVTVLDLGANVDSPPEHLVQFGVMGSIYHSHLCRVERPTVGLLSNGEERVKGNEVTLRAHQLLEKSSLNFIGNVEGRDILGGKCDVVVTDGFVGNILLKFGESVQTFIAAKMRRQISSNLFSRLGAFLMSPFLKRLKNSFDYSKYGGAPLLGVNGVMVVCHGQSSPGAIKNAVAVAVRMVKGSVNSHIRERLASTDLLTRAR